MDPKIILAKIKQYPFAVGGAVVSIILIILIWQRGGISEILEAERDEVDKEWTIIEENDRRAVQLKEHVAQLKANAAELGERLMSAEQRALNYQYIFELEAEAGIRIQSLNQAELSKTRKKGAPKLTLFQPITYTLSARGTYTQILDFLNKLHRGKYFVRVDDFNSSSASQVEPGLVSISLSMDFLGSK